MKLRLSVVALWLLGWFILGDEPAALARMVVAPRDVPSIRVVSLNCASSLDAVREVVPLQPDVVLVQESPGSIDLNQVRSELGGDWSLLTGVDASILARGKLTPVPLPPGTSNFTAAWADLQGEDVLIVSLRMRPPVFRLDYWNPACWTAYAANKSARRKELAPIAAFIKQQAGESPLILGGDFNTPPDRTITRSLDSIAADSWAVGRGWGATAINEFPMVRIDQIWASDHFQPINAFSRKTRNSDHQIAVANLHRIQ